MVDRLRKGYLDGQAALETCDFTGFHSAILHKLGQSCVERLLVGPGTGVFICPWCSHFKVGTH